MSVNYGILKSMKTAKIGTIMLWAGDGNEGILLSNIPKGWLLCDGVTHPASRYPILTSIIGNSYGGTSINGEFPHYTGTCKVPNISTRCMIDLEPSMLNDTRYQYGQSDAATVLGNLVSDDGLTTSIPTLISADTDLAFNPLPTGNLVGKMTDVTITAPTFQTTVYTIARKLGINHMPYHTHPGFYTRATTTGTSPSLYKPSTVSVGGNRNVDGNCGLLGWTEAALNNADSAETWCSGRMPITYYDEDTLITTDKFNQFISTSTKSYDTVPPSTAVARVLEDTEYTDAFSSIPVTTHAMPTWTGLFPRPTETSNRRNYFGYNPSNPTVGPTGLQDDPEGLTAKTVNSVTITGGSTFISLPAGTLIGTDYTEIVPTMLVKSSATSGIYLLPGVQILSIERTSGTSTANYVYKLELSEAVQGTGSVNTTLTFFHGTYPTTLNTTASGQDPSSTSMQSHNHASFDITMSGTNLQGVTTHPVNDMTIGNVAPETITGALNIIANIANPSVNIVYIIRAY